MSSFSLNLKVFGNFLPNADAKAVVKCFGLNTCSLAATADRCVHKHTVLMYLHVTTEITLILQMFCGALMRIIFRITITK